ncbi:MAG: ABC transporter ATP-binding protein [Spirochaetales bacterium]|nr:ABC transporter ATP-binding protein [Spirochaetales bacterium]
MQKNRSKKDFRILDYISKCKLHVFLYFLVSMLYSLIYFGLFLVFKYVYEGYIEKPADSSLSSVFFTVIAVSVIGVTVFAVGNLLGLRLNHKFKRIIRDRLTETLIHAPYVNFINMSGGEMVNVLIPETDTVSEALFQIVKTWVYSIQIVIFLAALAFLDYRIALVFAGIILTALALMNIGNKRISRVNRGLSAVRDKNFSFFYTYIQSIREIKCYNLAEFQNDLYRSIARDERKKNLELAGNTVFLDLFTELPLLVCMFVLYVWGFYKLRGGMISFGYLLSFIGFVGRFGFLAAQLSTAIAFLQNSNFSFRRLQEFLGIGSEPREGEWLQKKITNIDIRKLSFGYNNKARILKNLDIMFPANSFISLVGESGSGKSTIVNLLMRLFHVRNGSIFIDGIDINKINPESIREHIGIVSQSGIILNDSLRRNIDLKDRLTDSEVLRICHDVGLDELLEKLPDGIYSAVSADGKNLSGGENQRILIARCLAKGTNICILDEATSALDFRVEKKIISMLISLKQENPDFSIISITHRPSFAKYSDLIYTLRNGQIAEVGTHEELTENNGYYVSLFTEKKA